MRYPGQYDWLKLYIFHSHYLLQCVYSFHFLTLDLLLSCVFDSHRGSVSLLSPQSLRWKISPHFFMEVTRNELLWFLQYSLVDIGQKRAYGGSRLYQKFYCILLLPTSGLKGDFCGRFLSFFKQGGGGKIYLKQVLSYTSDMHAASCIVNCACPVVTFTPLYQKCWQCTCSVLISISWPSFAHYYNVTTCLEVNRIYTAL